MLVVTSWGFFSEKYKMYFFDKTKLPQSIVKTSVCCSKWDGNAFHRESYENLYAIEFGWGYMFRFIGNCMISGPFIEQNLQARLLKGFCPENKLLNESSNYRYRDVEFSENSFNVLRSGLVNKKIITLEKKNSHDMWLLTDLGKKYFLKQMKNDQNKTSGPVLSDDLIKWVDSLKNSKKSQPWRI